MVVTAPGLSARLSERRLWGKSVSVRTRPTGSRAITFGRAASTRTQATSRRPRTGTRTAQRRRPWPARGRSAQRRRGGVDGRGLSAVSAGPPGFTGTGAGAVRANRVAGCGGGGGDGDRAAGVGVGERPGPFFVVLSEGDEPSQAGRVRGVVEVQPRAVAEGLRRLTGSDVQPGNFDARLDEGDSQHPPIIGRRRRSAPGLCLSPRQRCRPDTG
jgi:hypothetical protein